jgi:hypothetical protein
MLPNAQMPSEVFTGHCLQMIKSSVRVNLSIARGKFEARRTASNAASWKLSARRTGPSVASHACNNAAFA